MAQEVFFLAGDSGNESDTDLWVSDGTQAGTTPIGGISNIGVADSATGGLGPEDLTVFGNQMIFAGADSLNDAETNGLWLTDGTPGGTTEVGGPSPGPGHSSAITGANPNGLAPSNFTTFGSNAIFTGLDSGGFDGLWVTDGTVAGTIELGGLGNSGIVNSKVGGFSTENFAAFGNSVLFDGTDADGFQGLWISDGTTAGTVEIGGLKNAAIGDSGQSNFIANNFITLGSLELFSAPNAEGNESLWVTDGTATGTQEIGGKANEGVAGGYNVNLGDGLQYAARLGDRVLFAGDDTNGGTGLWSTDGTASGTTEIGGLDDAGVNGPTQSASPNGLAPTDITVNGPSVLFNGVSGDADNTNELWTSDGTAAGTKELSGGLADEASTGLNPEDIVSLGNGKAVFIGYDSNNNNKATLWVTDGTRAGTEEIGGLNNENIADANATNGLTIQVDTLMGGDGIAYFTAENTDGTQTSVLWETDGTATGTKIVPGTDEDSDGIIPQNMALGPVPASADDFTTPEAITLSMVPGESATLSGGTTSSPYTVTGSNGTIALISAIASIVGGGNLISFAGKSETNTVTLSQTGSNKDTVDTGTLATKGAIVLDGDAQVSVYGENDQITFASGTTGNVVNIYDTDSDTDGVNGSNGTVNLYSSQVAVENGGNDTVNFYGTGDIVYIETSGSNFDTVNGSNGSIEIQSGAGAYVYGTGDTITLNSGGTLSIPGTETLSLTGSESLSGAIVGAGELAIRGSETIIHTGATLTVADVLISGSSTTLEVGTIAAYAGTLNLSSGTLSIANTDTLTLTGSDSLSGTIASAGELAIAGKETIIHSGAKLTTASLLISGSSTTLEVGTIPTYSGALTESGGTLSIANADTLTLTGSDNLSGTIASAGELAIAGKETIVHSGAKLQTASVSISGSSTTLEVGTIPTYAGAITEASGTLSIANADTLSLTGTNSFSGAVSSAAGELAIAGGNTTIHTGASLAVSAWSILGASTDVTLDEALTYSGAFSMAAGTLDLAAGSLTLSGADSFTGGAVDGSHILLTQGSTKTVSGLTLGGTVEWENTTTVDQSGQVTLGDGSGDVAFLDNASTGVYDLLGNVGFSEGSSTASHIANAGLFEKTAGTGISTIKPAVANTGTIKVSDGELVLQGALTGTGTDTIAGAATLKFDSTVASGQSVTFTGNDGLLNLGSPQGFSGAIKDFDLGGATNDAIDIASGWTFTGATEAASSTTLGFTEGSTHISLTLQGAYTATFHSTAISSGTQITYG